MSGHAQIQTAVPTWAIVAPYIQRLLASGRPISSEMREFIDATARLYAMHDLVPVPTAEIDRVCIEQISVARRVSQRPTRNLDDLVEKAIVAVDGLVTTGPAGDWDTTESDMDYWAPAHLMLAVLEMAGLTDGRVERCALNARVEQ